VAKKGDKAGEEAVSDTAQSAVIAESASAHRLEERLCPGVVRDGGAGHVEESITQSWLARSAHGDVERETRALGHRSGPAACAEDARVRVAEKMASLSEDGRGDKEVGARKRVDDSGIVSYLCEKSAQLCASEAQLLRGRLEDRQEGKEIGDEGRLACRW
jgi:hypothetical protein